uniref:TATA box-binding protein-associated factor RNA polymerase I subunit B n=1 Tax=Anopheles minimus TaxID=112268 RepID=A0A182W3G6_9DIPT
MATAIDKCELCGLDDFTLEDGFYYCTECGTKLLNKREIVDDDINVGCQTTLRAEVGVESKITSWEQMNYFLHGLTVHLVELGAPEELKATVLQIWCAYLNIAEIAFFHKRQRKRPRLGLRNQKWDLKVLFNRNPPKRIRRKVEKSGEISLKRRRKQNQDMLKAEQDALTQSQNSDVESTLSSLSTSMLSSSNSVQTPLSYQFNRRARKRLLEDFRLDEEHIAWHEQEAPEDANCHTFPYKFVKQNNTKEEDNWSYIHRKSILIAILSLGLNQVRSSIQMSDLIRWIEEGHLSLNNLRQYLPEGIDPACYSETVTHLSTYYQGVLTSLIASDLGIVPIHPDLSLICSRFLSELALPLDLAPYIAKVIAIAPGIKQTYAYSYFPKYELHAMKYILFIMKLFFGLDGVNETKLDTITEKLNERIGPSDKFPKLFVWREWQRYVTMRRIILEQLHYPTSHSRAQSIVNRPVESDLFLSFFETRVVPDDDNTTGYQAGLVRPSHNPAQERLFKNLHTIIASATETIHSNRHSVPPKKHIEFDHSMEPQRTYFAEILKMDDTERQNVYIPEYMVTDHSKRTVAPFVNPMPLKRHFLANRKVRLVTKNIKPTIKHIQMVKHNPRTNVELYLSVNKFVQVLTTDEPDSRSSEDENDESNILNYIHSKAERHKLSHEDILRNTLCQNTVEEMESNLRAVEFEVVAKDTELSWIKELKGDVNPFKNNPTIDESLPEEDRCSETVQIALPNFYYWINHGHLKCIPYDDFEKDYFSTFPPNFQFLLREAAYVTRCSTLDLYLELNELEKYFFQTYSQIK